MKNTILKAILAVVINTMIGLCLSAIVGLPIWFGVIVINLIGCIAPMIPIPAGLRAGVYQEVWTREVVEHFSHAQEGTFLDGVPDFSQYADNDVIHLNEVSGDPDVLINNTTYPLVATKLDDGDIAISLDKFETLPTSITDDELHAISYDKMSVVKTRHGNKIAEGRLDKAIHAFAPQKDTVETPVLKTTGSADGNRLKLCRKDIIALRRKLDALKIPKSNRRLVLCNDHVNDLLEEDQKFQGQYHNYATGAIAKMYGFDIYEYVSCPIYGQDLAKKAFGAAPAENDFEASVFFYVPRMFKSDGSTKMYYSEAAKDPLNKRNIVSFTNRFVALPQVAKCASGAIVSGKATV